MLSQSVRLDFARFDELRKMRLNEEMIRVNVVGWEQRARFELTKNSIENCRQLSLKKAPFR